MVPVVPAINIETPENESGANSQEQRPLPSLVISSPDQPSEGHNVATPSVPSSSRVSEGLSPATGPSSETHTLGADLSHSPLLRAHSRTSATTFDISEDESHGPRTPVSGLSPRTLSVDLAPNSPVSFSGSFGGDGGHNATLLRANDPLKKQDSPRRSVSFSDDGRGDDGQRDNEPQTPLSNLHKLDDPEKANTDDISEGAKSEEDKGVSHQVDRIDPDADLTNPTPFLFKPAQLALNIPKELDSIERMGGTRAVLRGLGSSETKGINTKSVSEPGEKATTDLPDDSSDGFDTRWNASMDRRREVYGHNKLPDRKSKGLLQLMWLALQDRVLIILIIAAVVSLALGLYQDFGAPPHLVACSDGTIRCSEPKVDWVEGVAILIAVIVVVVVGSVNDYQKEQQFKVLNAKKEDRGVKVIRDGRETIINVHDVVVGDVCLLEPGEIVPVDGLFLSGHNVRCDEGAATGETDAIRKAPFEDCWEEHLHLKSLAAEGERVKEGKKDCFIVSGSKVMEGVGSYVATAVGTNSFYGRLLTKAQDKDQPATPLQTKLNRLAELIAKLGSIAGGLLFFALMIRFFVQLGTEPNRSASDKAQSFIQILIISVTLVVVAVPEGLPLAVTLALSFATKRMTKENLLVRVLASCETMSNSTVVCTDKTGTLTQNVMSVVAGAVGVRGKFVRSLEENRSRTNAGKVDEKDLDSSRRYKDDFSVDLADLNACLSPALQRTFNEAIAINSTAFEDEDPATQKVVFVGSKTETALLRMAKELGWADYKKTREAAEIVQMIPFSSERKSMAAVVKLSDTKWRMYVKGASEILTKLCTSHVVVQQNGSTEKPAVFGDDVETRPLGDVEIENIDRTIIFYANQMLRTIAICYRDFEKWPPVENTSNTEEVPYSYLAQDMTLLSITGIEDPLRPGVREAVADCQRAGVQVKMCTGDNVLTARSIATQCGIYQPGGIIMEGPVFRTLNDHELLDIVPRLQVLARSSPEDKEILVNALKRRGEIVGVTGDGSNDSLALEEAHVGFSMGIAGTEVAKASSDIILMDDNFASIVSAIMWGRCVNDAVKKFLQFQISVNITAVVITFVTAVASNSETSVLTAVQLLWINIIMDTAAALALATDPAHPSLLDRLPDRLGAPLFNIHMCKMILGQSIYQIVIILIFHFAGDAIFGYNGLSEFEKNKADTELGTLIFNAFVFCQIFNSINSRKLDDSPNIFDGFFRNKLFLGITLLEIGIQILIVFVGGSAFQVTRMNGRDWGISIALGFMSIPIGYVIRLIPNPPCERFFIALHVLPDPNALPVVAPHASEDHWNHAIDTVRDNLATFANIRGGRVRASSFVGKSRSGQLKKANIQLPSLLAMVPTLVASSIGAGWTPQDLSDPASADPSRSSAALYSGQVTVHPDTDPDDEMLRRFGKQPPV